MLQELKADLARYPGGTFQRMSLALRCAGFYPVVVYRIGHDIYVRWPRSLAMLAKVPYKIVAFLTEWATGISIAPDATIGPGLYIGHWGCTRIGTRVKLGANCNISPMVFMGLGARDGKLGVPELGDRVYVAVGAKIIGPVKVGSDVAIGANAVVCKDVPDHVTVGGIPAKVISRKGSAAYIQVGQEIEIAPTPERSIDIAEVRRANEDVVRRRGASAHDPAKAEEEAGRSTAG